MVTIAAAGFQKDIAKQVREQGGDDLPAGKGNRLAPHDAVYAVFVRATGSAKDRHCDNALPGGRRSGCPRVGEYR